MKVSFSLPYRSVPSIRFRTRNSAGDAAIPFRDQQPVANQPDQHAENICREIKQRGSTLRHEKLRKLAHKTPDNAAKQDKAGCFCEGSVQAECPAPEKRQDRVDDDVSDGVGDFRAAEQFRNPGHSGPVTGWRQHQQRSDRGPRESERPAEEKALKAAG